MPAGSNIINTTYGPISYIPTQVSFKMKGIACVSLLLLSAFMAEANPTKTRGGFHKSASTLIVGGRPARQGEAPYQLTIQNSNRHLCGATLVEINGTQLAITAAHCISSSQIPNYSVVGGDIRLSDVSGLEQKVDVEDVIVHQNYSDSTLANDIAVILLNGTFLLNDNVKTVPLPRQGQQTYQGNLTVSGWGDTEYMGNAPDDLQIVSIPIVNDTQCEEAYQNWFYQVPAGTICTVSEAGDLNPCHGDSGGPAISDEGYLAGVVSWGYECGHPDYPAVFTRVSYFIDWIHETFRNNKKLN